MITLDATTKSLEIKLAGAATTTELPFVVGHVDLNQSTWALTGAGEQDGVTTGSTAVEVVAAPGATTSRKLNYLSVVNVDTVAAVLTVQVNNNATKRIVFKATLAIGDQLSYTDAFGWKIFDSSGNQKTTMQNAPLSITNAMLAGSIAASKLIATDFTTITASGTITGGVITGVTGNYTGLVKLTAPAGSVALQMQGRAADNAAEIDFTSNDGATLYGIFQSSAAIIIFGTFSAAPVGFYTSSTLRQQINTNGTQTWAPYGAGAATFDASGNITSVSDVRFKDRIAPLPYGLGDVLALKPVQHGYNALSELDRDHLYGGFLAHEVQAIMPIAVGQDPRGYLTLADRPILGAVVNAIKELDARLRRLEERHG